MMEDKKIIIALGSNQGDRLANLKLALSNMVSWGFRINERSSVWETAPWGDTDQDSFYNMCVSASCEKDEATMLSVLKDIEMKVGRIRTRRWGPRVIDLDIIFSGDVVMETEDLTIPHTYMHKRAFVLRPLAEIEPDFVHPVLKKSVSQLLEELGEDDETMKKVAVI